MKVLVFLNEKGGVGKSTLSTIIAAMLAAMGYRVVFIDADPQGNSTEFFGLTKAPSFYKFLTVPQNELAQANVTRKVAPEHYTTDPNCPGVLHIIGGDVTTRHLASMIENKQLSPGIVRQRTGLLNPVADYVIYDTAPTPSDLLKAVVAAGDLLFMPTECEPFSGFQGVPDTKAHTGNLAKLAEDRGIDASRLAGILPNMYVKKSAVHNSVLTTLRETYGSLVWQEVPETETIKQSHLQRKSLHVLYPRTKVTKLLWSFAQRIEAMA